MMQFRRASTFSVPELTRLWNRGYTDFFVPSAFTEREMAGFLWSSDIDLAHSVVAMDGERPAGFSLLGVRGQRGWIGGVGIAPEYRGRGLGSMLFREHMAVIRRETDLRSVQLEVLVQNWAHKLYDRNDFVRTRRLSFLEGLLPEGRTATGVSAGSPGALLTHSERLHAAWPPAWQREPSDLRRCFPPVERALWTGTPDGYLLYNQHGRHIWIADVAAGDSVPTAAALIDALAQRYPGFTVAVGDEPAGSPFHRALSALGCREVHARWEMHCPIPARPCTH